MCKLLPDDPVISDYESTSYVMSRPFTLEDVAILVHPSIAKLIPFHLMHISNSFYLLYLGRISFPKPIPSPITLEYPIIFEELFLADSERSLNFNCRSLDVKISLDSGTAKTVFFDILPFGSVSYLIPRDNPLLQAET
jgi:hypothetical protein